MNFKRRKYNNKHKENKKVKATTNFCKQNVLMIKIVIRKCLME